MIEIADYLDHHQNCSWWILVNGVRQECLPGSYSQAKVVEYAKSLAKAKVIEFDTMPSIRIEKW